MTDKTETVCRGEAESESVRALIDRQAAQYRLLEHVYRIPLSEYTPEDDYGSRAFDTAFEMKELGALLTVFIPQDILLRSLVGTSETEDDFLKNSLRAAYSFLDENPDAAKDWFYVDEFDAVGLDDFRYGKTKTETGTRLMCARLDPSRFECSVIRLEKPAFGMGLGVELRYTPDPRWSLFGYVPNNPELPYGRYILVTDDKTTEWPCVCGSRVTVSNHMLLISATVAALRSVNRRKTQA